MTREIIKDVYSTKLPFKKRKRFCTCIEKRSFIHNNRSQLSSIKKGCELMGISGSTYYYRPKRNLAKKKRDADIADAIEEVATDFLSYG